MSEQRCEKPSPNKSRQCGFTIWNLAASLQEMGAPTEIAQALIDEIQHGPSEWKAKEEEA